jgi:hypothetical protein
MLAVSTFSGRSLYPQAPTAEAIDLADLAHALSQVCRFAGQIGAFYSVAQHSVHCSELCEPADALHGLLHDAAEAYLGDLPRPVKTLAGLEAYTAVETHLQAVIFHRFGLSATIPASVRRADDWLCRFEARELFPVPPAWAVREDETELMHSLRISPWSSRAAKGAFLRRFADLGGRR